MGSEIHESLKRTRSCLSILHVPTLRHSLIFTHTYSHSYSYTHAHTYTFTDSHTHTLTCSQMLISHTNLYSFTLTITSSHQCICSHNTFTHSHTRTHNHTHTLTHTLTVRLMALTFTIRTLIYTHTHSVTHNPTLLTLTLTLILICASVYPLGLKGAVSATVGTGCISPPSRDSHYFHYFLHHLESQRHSRENVLRQEPPFDLGSWEGKSPRQKGQVPGGPHRAWSSVLSSQQGASHTLADPPTAQWVTPVPLGPPRRTKEECHQCSLPMLDSHSEDTEGGDSTQEKWMHC